MTAHSSEQGPQDTRPYDVLVVGAGPAGLACAIGLASHNKRVVIIDRGAKPQDKACGEGLMADGLVALEALGIHTHSLAGMPLTGVTYIDGPRSLMLDWSDTPALGLRRTQLSQVLWQRALAAGVETLAGRVTQVEDGADEARVWLGTKLLRATWVVGADGLHSVVRRALTQPPTKVRKDNMRMGLRQHFAVTPWSRHVEVYLAEGYEAYVTPVAPDEVGVAILGPRVDMPLLAALAPFPELQQRLDHAAATSVRRGAGPLYQQVKAVAGRRVALVGDASGYVDAVTGEGLTLALGEAALVCRCIASEAGLKSYPARHRALTARYRFSVATLLWLGRHPRLRSAIIWLACLCPAGASALARWATSLPQ